MFTDPQSVTVNAVAQSLVRVGSKQPERLGRFTTTEGDFELTTRQDVTSNRFRREVRLTQTKIAADPISALNKQVGASVLIVFDEPRTGFSNTEMGYLSSALVAWLTAPKRDQLLAGEL